ncbi:RNA polymerase sigma factor [Echinicola arenosa]|uniref:RNA polymerase sigma factor n=1 Tax=Echinicola arenosa TaxID=2774144 RepID=UPI00293BD2AA|nr:sigma-70 family RNA polymerase sigma factor [Echinicola arenosa]
MYPSDKELLSKVNQGCRNAFRQIYEAHWESLYQAAYARLLDQVMVEDLVQEIFIDLWNRRESLELHSTLKAYLHTAVKYQVLKKLDAQRIKRELEIADQDVLYYQEDVLGFQDLYQELEVALEKLPEKSRLIFTMSRFEGLSTDEIAQKLNLSPQTIHNRMSQSLSLIRTELKEYAPVIALMLLN